MFNIVSDVEYESNDRFQEFYIDRFAKTAHWNKRPDNNTQMNPSRRAYLVQLADSQLLVALQVVLHLGNRQRCGAVGVLVLRHNVLLLLLVVRLDGQLDGLANGAAAADAHNGRHHVYAAAAAAAGCGGRLLLLDDAARCGGNDGALVGLFFHRHGGGANGLAAGARNGGNRRR